MSILYLLCLTKFVILFKNRRYRDKEPAPAPITTTPRAITPSELKKPTINVTVNPKTISTNAPNATTTKPAKVVKKIDMGAASNFGRDEIGINSPTHRNTHAEEDLFATSNTNVPTTITNKTDLLDDIFKTCSTTNNLVADEVLPQSNNDADFFNPRDDESQEFGDFASAFGATTQTTQPEPLVEKIESKKNEFADFSAAFTSTEQTPSNSNDPSNLLFAINSTPNAQTTTSNSNPKVGDLLSDLDGLTLDVSTPSGKLITLDCYVVVDIVSCLSSFSYFHVHIRTFIRES